MAQLTSYGKRVKKALIDQDKNQAWLLKEVHEKTGLFVDDGYFYKIFTGQRNAPNVVAAINEILDLPTESDENRESDAV